MKPLAVIIVVLAVTSGLAQTHDLAATEIISPSGEWLRDSVEVIPQVRIVNLGTEHETFVPVELYAVDCNENMDTVYAESVIVHYIGPAGSLADTVDVEFPAWWPEGICIDWQEQEGYALPDQDEKANKALIGRHYKFVGLCRLPDDEDLQPDNDTCRMWTKCLLPHDVGAVDLENEEGHEWSGYYPTGTEFTCIATVENIGYNEENDVVADLEIYDVNAEPESLVWHNAQGIETLDWRGNDSDNPYWVEVRFPSWTTPSEDWFRITCRTEMQTDDCPVNDVVGNWFGIDEDIDRVKVHSLKIEPDVNAGTFMISFSLPDQGKVKVGVFDVNGCKVTTLAERCFEPGIYFRSWSGTDDTGRKVAAGIYLVRMEAEGFEEVRKVVVIE
ncbi:hypothetical protein GF359_07470 [candidate division WOR-3 bacterium]|uniref:FlgD Ig-like domain-containing protein n=1 Tax=candidate division WOR-3 bacterium TaxID=2052148 RepID=A0A9D5QCX8_UNCW3|nr:hypothetical protein [candidate division WOR-3 bacterium]MBD3365039.1 hypothetical protein [candidate division WOR-3 bacterium]